MGSAEEFHKPKTESTPSLSPTQSSKLNCHSVLLPFAVYLATLFHYSQSHLLNSVGKSKTRKRVEIQYEWPIADRFFPGQPELEFIVVSAYKEKRVSEGMEENLFKGLKEAEAIGREWR